jgi:rubrerythrin
MKKGPARGLSGTIARGLQQALLNEVDGREFYRMAAKSTRRDGVRRMFAFLMKEEERHREAIVAQIARMAEGKPPKPVGGAARRKGIRKFRSPLFTEDFVAKGKNVEGEAAALSIGMTLEKRAIEQFSGLRKKAQGDAPTERLFDDLIAWEKEHLDVLTRQYEQLREMYWEETRFWPF